MALDIFGVRIGRVSRLRSKTPIVFMHLPKTGGTSLDSALSAFFLHGGEPNVHLTAVRGSGRLLTAATGDGLVGCRDWVQLMNAVVCYKMACNAPYISGHFQLTEALIREAPSAYRFVTLLREPVERWISNYIYSRIRLAQDGIREVPDDLAGELQEVLRSERGIAGGRTYLTSLTGARSAGEGARPEMIEAAKRTLEAFDAVGVLEQIDRFEGRLEKLIGAPLKIPHLRKTDDFAEPGGNSAADYRALFTDEVVAQVRRLCEPDREVYQHAQVISGGADGADSLMKDGRRRTEDRRGNRSSESSHQAGLHPSR